MRLLLDTHALPWGLDDAPELSGAARAAIDDSNNEKLLSIGSLWEISIKVGRGRLELAQPLPQFFARIKGNRNIRLIPIQTDHLLWLASLPQHHRGPFDRLIVAQALSERCTLVSRDTQLDAYGISRLW